MIEGSRETVHDILNKLERRVDTNDARGESDVRLIAQRLHQMEKHIEANDKRIEDLIRERDSLFKWGILALGSIVIAAGTWAITVVLGSHYK